MKIILLKDVKGTGKKYDVKDVSDGYAMNFLIPNKLAERSTPERIKRLDELKEGQFDEERVQAELQEDNLKSLSRVQLEITEKASEKGGLFKGITPADLVKELKKQVQLNLPASAIVLEKPIKDVGDYTINVVIGEGKTSFKLVVIAK
jgi:large subunit ribosomal protein L9